jgi:hypothetical protein
VVGEYLPLRAGRLALEGTLLEPVDSRVVPIQPLTVQADRVGDPSFVSVCETVIGVPRRRIIASSFVRR